MGLRGPCCSMTAVTCCFLLLLLVDVSFSDPIVPPPLKHTPQAFTCQQTRDSGNCSSYIAKWFYDAAAEQCDVFYYSGCGGNDNRFQSQAECEYHCLPGDHTLPPYMTRRDPTMPSGEHHEITTTTKAPVTTPSSEPLPPGERGEHLTLPETGHHDSFTYSRANSYIQLDGDGISSFQLRYSREIRLWFRTRMPHGLLAYHGVKRPSGLPTYALFVLLQKGQLRVKHVIGENTTILNVGKGLNRDRWHEVRVRVDVERALLLAQVDEHEQETPLIGLNEGTGYDVTTDLPSIVYIGGLSPEERLVGVKRLIASLVGCIRGVSLAAGPDLASMNTLKPLIASRHGNVEEGCNDRCRTRRSLCFPGSKCLNHYSHYTCDCFGTLYEGEYCDMYTATVVTMRGYSYLSYRVYDWKDRVHSSENRLSIMFKTNFDDSTLFYANGESHKQHHVAVSILNNSVHVDMDFGSGPLVFMLGDTFGVTDNHWHNLTISHRGPKVTAILDTEVRELDVPDNHHHLYLDPEICVGGGHNMKQRKGHTSQNNFVGSLKYAYFNEINLLYELRRGSPRAQYVSLLEPEYEETEVRILPLTLPFPASHVLWPLASRHNLALSFDFKSTRAMAVLAAGNATTPRGLGHWEVRVVNEEIRFELVPLNSENVTHRSSVRFDPRGAWHHVNLTVAGQHLSLTVDYRHSTSETFDLSFEFGDAVMIGSGTRANTGLVGCLRHIEVDGEKLIARAIVRSPRAIGQLSLDNCQLVDPCSRPDACKHGGKCSVKNDRIDCDCKGTGYTGKNCHFAEFRKTCEELALLGYTEPDVYLIDIDGNGRFPPTHVKCEFQGDQTKTIVEHNLPSQVDVRGVQYEDFRFEIEYREFSGEMLQELIAHSLFCRQYIKYDCSKAPLNLHSATWFISSARTKVIDFLGESPPGLCPCGVNRTCVSSNAACHCDANEDKWHADEAYFTEASSLGITEMVFLQQPSLDSDAQGRMTLGPLECVEENTQKYVVTFTSSQSYIEVPGWRTGDIAFSFRTTGERAILLHQPPIRAGHPCFTVVLSNDYELTFSFMLWDGARREMKIQSDRKLNGGDWQKIWIDYNEHHVRFMINTRAQMVDLAPGEQFGPFEGSMFIGGAPDHFRELLPDPNIREGLIGCFRGLVVNGEILDIYSYISVHLSEIIKDCKPSCDPNPCRNEATCKEHWSSYECQCVNPWAHLGDLCETDVNQEGLTFKTEEAFVKSVLLSSNASDTQQLYGSEMDDMRLILEENLLLNVRTHQHRAILLYAHDHLNNFVQLHIENGDTVVFAFNSGDNIEVLRVQHKGLTRGESVQIAIIRGLEATTLHVEDGQSSTTAPFKLLTKYLNKPWRNPELESLAPQRPPVPPSEYFAISLGGIDVEDFKTQSTPLPGFVGCLRGLRVADKFLMSLLPNPIILDGVSEGCNMKCDERPCHNQGICTEDFLNSESTCNCTHTSYFGPNCAEEKGASFNGDSYLLRNLNFQVDNVMMQLAFSTKEVPSKDFKSVLLFIDKDPDYLMVALNSNGVLEIEESLKDGSWKANLTDLVSFINGARHSVLYQRPEVGNARLWIDRKPVEIVYVENDYIFGSNESSSEEIMASVYVGGLRSMDMDPRFKNYRNYSGCLSNVQVDVHKELTRPLEEYMGFSRNRTDNEKVQGFNAAGIKSGFCATFDKPFLQLAAGPLPNVSMLATERQWKDKTWVEDPPSRIPYKAPPGLEPGPESESNTSVILIALAMVFVAIVIACVIELVRNNRQHKRKKRQQQDMWVMGAPPKYPDSILHNSAANVKMTGFKNLEKTKAMNGTELQPLTRTEEALVTAPADPGAPNGHPQPRPHHSPPVTPKKSPPSPPQRSEPDEKQDNSEAELQWDPIGEGEELLGGSLEPSVDMDADDGTGNPSDEGDEERRRSEPNISSPTSTRSEVLPPATKVPPVRPPRWKKLRSPTSPPPVFLSEHQRTFGNPISYLGGPLARSNYQRASKESVISID